MSPNTARRWCTGSRPGRCRTSPRTRCRRRPGQSTVECIHTDLPWCRLRCLCRCRRFVPRSTSRGRLRTHDRCTQSGTSCRAAHTGPTPGCTSSRTGGSCRRLHQHHRARTRDRSSCAWVHRAFLRPPWGRYTRQTQRHPTCKSGYQALRDRRSRRPRRDCILARCRSPPTNRSSSTIDYRLLSTGASRSRRRCTRNPPCSRLGTRAVRRRPLRRRHTRSSRTTARPASAIPLSSSRTSRPGHPPSAAVIDC